MPVSVVHPLELRLWTASAFGAGSQRLRRTDLDVREGSRYATLMDLGSDGRLTAALEPFLHQLHATGHFRGGIVGFTPAYLVDAVRPSASKTAAMVMV